MKLLLLFGLRAAGVVSECFWKMEMWLTDFKSNTMDTLSHGIRKAKQRAEARLSYFLAIIPHAMDLTPAHVRTKEEEWMYQFVVGD